MSTPKRRARTRVVVVLTFLASVASAPPGALAETDATPRGPILIGLLGGGLLGQLRYTLDGEQAGPDEGRLQPQVDMGMLAEWRFGEHFLLGTGLGITGWHADSVDRIGYDRSRLGHVVISPGAYLPLGRCPRCPALICRMPLGAVISRFAPTETRVAYEERIRVGFGYLVGARVGMHVLFTERIGLRVEGGFSFERAFHHVEYEANDASVNLEDQTLGLGLARPVAQVGLWGRL